MPSILTDLGLVCFKDLCPTCQRGRVVLQTNRETGLDFFGCNRWRGKDGGCRFSASAHGLLQRALEKNLDQDLEIDRLLNWNSRQKDEIRRLRKSLLDTAAAEKAYEGEIKAYLSAIQLLEGQLGQAAPHTPSRRPEAYPKETRKEVVARFGSFTGSRKSFVRHLEANCGLKISMRTLDRWVSKSA